MNGRHFEKCSTHPQWVSWEKIKIKIMNIQWACTSVGWFFKIGIDPRGYQLGYTYTHIYIHTPTYPSVLKTSQKIIFVI
jgi:hypothetical protein